MKKSNKKESASMSELLGILSWWALRIDHMVGIAN